MELTLKELCEELCRIARSMNDATTPMLRNYLADELRRLADRAKHYGVGR